MKRFLMLFICLCLCAGLFPITAAAAPEWPSDVSIQADAGIVMDSDTGTVLYGKNMDQPYYPASITKILTALIVLEQCDLNEMVTFSHDDVYNVEAGSSSAGIDEGDVLTVRDCLYALMLASANESANALACHVSGSREAFAQLMNEKARSLGCTGSHFNNPSGLNDENHYTTAHDMAVITEYAMNTPNFMEISDQTRYTYSPLDGPEKGTERMVTTSNRLIDPNLDPQYYYSYARGIKTGFTDEAGYCIVSNAVNPNTGYSYLCVAMGAPSVDKNGNKVEKHGECIDSKNLYEWAFNNLRIQKIAAKEDAVTEIPLQYAWNKDKLLLTPEDDCSTILPEDISASSVLATPNIPESVEAPVKKGQVIGTVTFSYAGQDLLTTNLVAAESVERSELLKSAATIKDVVTSGWFLAIAAVVIVLVAAYLILALIYNRKKKKLRTVKKYKDL